MMKKHFQHKKKGYTISCIAYIAVIEVFLLNLMTL